MQVYKVLEIDPEEGPEIWDETERLAFQVETVNWYPFEVTVVEDVDTGERFCTSPEYMEEI